MDDDAVKRITAAAAELESGFDFEYGLSDAWDMGYVAGLRAAVKIATES